MVSCDHGSVESNLKSICTVKDLIIGVDLELSKSVRCGFCMLSAIRGVLEPMLKVGPGSTCMVSFRA